MPSTDLEKIAVSNIDSGFILNYGLSELSRSREQGENNYRHVSSASGEANTLAD